MNSSAAPPSSEQSPPARDRRNEAPLDEEPPPCNATCGPARGILVLYSRSDAPGQLAPREALADAETVTTAQAVFEVLRQHTAVDVQLVAAAQHVERRLKAFPPQDYVVFNLFEGVDGLVREDADDPLDEEARTALTLKELGYRFTGADDRTLALAVNKGQAKAALAAGGVLTPPWRVFTCGDEVSEASLAGVPFPVIVKPVAEDSSLGIDDNAVVSGLATLRARVAHITTGYRQSALVEAFIDGREINVALWGDPPQVLPLAEVSLSDLGAPEKRIVSFAAKWEEDSFDYQHTPVTCPAQLPEALAERIRATALRAWQITGCRGGYARVDMRVCGEEVYVLEVNPNPSIAPDAGFARCARAAGFDYPHMILHILSMIGEDLHVHHS